MRKIKRSDVKDIIEYEKVRPQFRQQIIEIKKGRRVSVGPYLTFVFENRDTVLFQIEEMLRAERIVREEGIAFEIETYNSLIPGENELSATMLIEVTDLKRVKPVLDRFMGIDQGEKVWLQFANARVVGAFEQGRSNDEKISAVHFVRFTFAPQEARRFRAGEDRVSLVVMHPNYQRKAVVPDNVLASLRADLES